MLATLLWHAQPVSKINLKVYKHKIKLSSARITVIPRMFQVLPQDRNACLLA